MSSLPIELDFTRDPAATPARMDRAMVYLLAAVRRVEAGQPEFATKLDELRRIGFQRLTEVLSPLVIDAQEIAAVLAALRADWLSGDPLQHLLDGLSDQVTARLATFQALVDDLDDEVTTRLAALVIGETIQSHSDRLDALAGVAANDFGRSLLTLATASTLRQKAELGSIATLAEASAADFRSAADARALSVAAVWQAAQSIALVDAATIAVDLSAFINATVTLGGNRTLGAPTNGKPYQSGLIEIRQDATGGRALAFASAWSFGPTLPTLSTAANARDLLYFQVLSDGKVDAYLSKAR